MIEVAWMGYKRAQYVSTFLFLIISCIHSEPTTAKSHSHIFKTNQLLSLSELLAFQQTKMQITAITAFLMAMSLTAFAAPEV